MIAAECFEKALASVEPSQALRRLVLDLATKGHPKTAIYEALEHFLLCLRSRDKRCEREEEAVLDVMDALSGWCHPSAQLLPDR